MSKDCYRCVLVSDFNMGNLSAYLKKDTSFPSIEIIDTPFGQVIPTLMQKNLDCWLSNPDFAVVWTQPQGVINSFNHLLEYKPVSMADIISEIDEYSRLLMDLSKRISSLFVPLWVIPSDLRGLGMLDMRPGIGIANTLMHMNIMLAENLRKSNNIYLMNTQKWIEKAGRAAFNPKLWYMGKIPFGNEVFKEALQDIKAAVRGIAGQAKKIIVLDLDDTLWGGIVGDVGWENIRLGGHDHIGEAFGDFQSALKSLTNRGVLLGVVSKNEESIALEALNKHPEMVIRQDDLAGWKIDWKDKAQNIVDLVAELNLGLESVVFIDDNPTERDRVRDALPEVLVPEWPKDKMLYKSALLDLRCFDSPVFSAEDSERTSTYVAQRKRKEVRREVSSVDDWLKKLNTNVLVESLNEKNIQRAVQLLNKTNQMNLSTRRMSEPELTKWEQNDGHSLLTFRVSDKLGDSGLTGILSIDYGGGTGRIIDFVLSCRVMGRKVEETMLAIAVKFARISGLEKLIAEYRPTAKNKPCLDFWRRVCPRINEKENCFVWKVEDDFPIPDSIKVGGDLE